MTGTEKQLILLGLFFVVAVNEDSAVVSGALLSYKHVFPAWVPFVACFPGMWIAHRCEEPFPTTGRFATNEDRTEVVQKAQKSRA